MKKQQFSPLLAVTLLFTGFLLGFSIGRSSHMDTIMVSVPEQMMTRPVETTTLPRETTAATEAIVFPININIAQEKELMALPGIGEVLASRILDYRDNHGAFAHVTDIMNVEGIGQAKMEAILDYVTTGG